MADYGLIYLARRNPAIAAADFGVAWRSHARFAEGLAPDFGRHFRSARQCLKIADAALPASFGTDYDGVALLGMTSRQAMIAARDHPIAADALLHDEDRVFAARVAPHTMAVESETIRRGSGARAFILSFLVPRAGVPAADFAAAVDAVAAGLADMPGLVALVRHRMLEPRPRGPAALLELRFPGGTAALAAARDAALVATVEAAAVADVAAGVRMAARLNPAA